MKTKALTLIILTVGLNSCISLKKHNEATSDLQSQISSRQDRLDNLSQELESTRSRLGQLGEISTSNSTSTADENRANSHKSDGSWITLKNPEVYKNYLTGGLGIIWLEKNDGSLIEGGYVDFGTEKAEPEIIDQGDIIFRYFVNNRFQSNLSIVTAVTASINNEDFARLRYEILGTSRLKISQTSIENIAKKYANRYSSEIKAVYLTTGFHVRKISLNTYTKMAANAVATVPVANVSGEFYNESESEINNWHVEARLIDLKLFVPNKELEENRVLARNETPYQLLKRIFGDQIPDEILLQIADNPSLMTEENIEKLNQQLGNKSLTRGEMIKLNEVGESLLKSQTNLMRENQ